MNKKRAVISFENANSFIGMVIEKQKAIHKCVGIIPYRKRNGTDTFLLEWESVSKISSVAYKQITGSAVFHSTLLQNHHDDKNSKKVLLGKRNFRKKRKPLST